MIANVFASGNMCLDLTHSWPSGTGCRRLLKQQENLAQNAARYPVAYPRRGTTVMNVFVVPRMDLMFRMFFFSLLHTRQHQT